MSFLVVYAGTHGHTARIAQRVAAVLREAGIAVDEFVRACARLRSPGSAVIG